MNNTILLIEDDPGVLENLKVLLIQEKYNVITAVDGYEGVVEAKKHIPDLIICDILMPKMNGYEVLKTLSIDSRTDTIPFLFLTAKTDIGDIRKGMGLGADDYLIKPYDIDELLNAIDIRLNKFLKIKGNQLDHLEEKTNEKGQLSENERIFLTVNNKPQFIKIKLITHIVAERQYTNLVLEDGTKILIRKSLSYWENILPDTLFVRIHRSIIINLDYVLKVEKWFKNSYKVILKDTYGCFIMSRRYASKLKNQF